MARAACKFARCYAPIEVQNCLEITADGALDVPKVTADIPNNVGPTTEPPKKSARPSFPLPHRGRDKLAMMRNANRKKIMEAPSRAAFWKEIKRLADPRPAPISVTADELKDVFEKRLNPPAVLPQFDSAQHKINKILATLIPEKTEDKTPEGFFTHVWTEDDMGRLKDHIRTHSLDSTPGEDSASYVELLEIPNEDLAYLANQCVEKGDGPTIWFMSPLIGILKRMKPHDNHDSYRLIA